MFKRTVLPLLILIILPLFCSGADYTNKEFASIMLSYDKTKPESSIEKLVNYLDDNSWHLDAYYQLFSWCFEKGDFSPLKRYQEWDNSSEHLLLAYSQYSEKPSDDLLKTIYSIIRKEKVSSYFAVLCADLVNSISDKNLKAMMKNQVLSSSPVSRNEYVLKIKFLLSNDEYDKSAELSSQAIAKYKDSPLLDLLYAHHLKNLASVKEKSSKQGGGKGTETFPDQQAQIINGYADALVTFYENDFKQSYDKLRSVDELCTKYGFNLFRTELLLHYAQSAFNIRNTKQAEELLDQSLDLLKKQPVPGYYYSYYKTLGNLLTAQNKFNEAFEAFNNCDKYAESPDQKGLAAISKGFLLLKIRKNDLCLKVVDGAIPLSEKSGNVSVLTGLYNLKAQVLREGGYLSEALDVTTKSYEIIKKTGNKKHQIPVLATMGNIFMMQGKFISAEKKNLEALGISREIGDVISEGKIYGSLALIYLKTIEDAKAIEYSEKAIEIFEKYNDKYNLALATGNMAQAFSNIGEYRKSLELYQKAVTLAREVNDIRSVALYYTGMGTIYKKSGNLDKALNIYEEAEKIYKELNSDYYTASYYANLANIYFDMEDFKKSDLYDQKAVEIFEKIGENWSLFTIYANQFSTGWAIKSKPRMRSSLVKIENLAKKMNDGYIDAEVDLLKAALYNIEKKPVQARQLLLDALKTFQHYRNNLIWVYYEIGLSYKLERDYKKALEYLGKSVALSEKERYNLRLGDISTGFINTNKTYYYEYIDTLFLYYLDTRLPEIKEKLFSSIEQLKERNFIDQLSESRASLDVHISADMKGKEIDILGRIAKANTDVNYAANDKELSDAETALNTAEAELEQLKTEIRNRYPIYADVNYPSAVDISIIMKNIPDGSTGLLEYYIQDDYLYIFYITKNSSMLWRKTNIKDIDIKVRELYKYLQKPDPAERGKLDEAASYLYDHLVYPVAKRGDLKKNLIIIPDEILFYLPFDVLRDRQGKYLVESYNITYAPSATSMKLISKTKLNRELSLLAVANPAHEYMPLKEKTAEKTVTRDFDFSLVNQPLPNAEREVSGISAFFDKNRKVTLVGKDAKEETIKSIDLTKFRFLHFATHGILDEENPLRSGLLLAIDRDPKEDGILQYREIYNLKTNADLVVLSACKTGLGKIVKGDGLIGISRGFLVSGSKSVIVSLWNVADYSTAILMQDFYRGLIKEGFTKAEALRKSKVALMKFNGEAGAERGITGISGSRKPVKKKVDFSHPYFWASFIIMGSPGK